MYKYLFSILLFITSPFFSNGQTVFDGIRGDSTTIGFNGGSSPFIVPDTSATPLWQMGLTHKNFFSADTFGASAMMTDTVNYYPAYANNFFVVKIPKQSMNTIVDFWHRYQTDVTHAGGMVEFSLDNGTTWQNITTPCSSESQIRMNNFYSVTDTLFNGEAAFMGRSDSTEYTRLQFFVGLPLAKPTSSDCNFHIDTFYLRFRFVSDSTVDSLAGWMIDSIKIESDIYIGAVAQINKQHTLNISPNPSYNGTFTFPAIEKEQNFSIEVFNVLGEKVMGVPYQHCIEITHKQKGLYFYKATNGVDYYSGSLFVE